MEELAGIRVGSYLSSFVGWHQAHMALWDSSVNLLFQRVPSIFSHGAKGAQLHLFTRGMQVLGTDCPLIHPRRWQSGPWCAAVQQPAPELVQTNTAAALVHQNRDAP